MDKKNPSKRLRRQKDIMQKVHQALVNLIRESANNEIGIVFEDIKAIFDEFGLSHLSTPSIRRDLELAGIKYNGRHYVLKGMIPAQKTSLELSKLIKDFDIFEPVFCQRLNPQKFNSLTLIQVYLRLKPGVNSEQLLEFKERLQQYLNQVHNLYLEEPDEYPLERYFFDITLSNQTICFLLNGTEALQVFYNLLTEINECDPKKSPKRVKLFHIIPK